jgi:regulator of sigma E protease
MLGQDDNPYRAAAEMKRARTAEGGQATAVANESAIAAGHHHLPGGDLPPEPTAEPHAPYDPRSYMAQSVPKRMAIISAGVIMNVIFAFVMATLAYMLGVKELPCRISQVFAGGAAWQAGLESGDEVVRIGNLEKPIYEDLRLRVPLSDVEEGVEFMIQREGRDEPFPKTLHPNADLGIPIIGVDGPRKLVLAGEPVERFSAASRASVPLLPGDRLLSVNDELVSSFKGWQQALVRFAKEPLRLTIAPDSGKNPESSAEPSASGSSVETAQAITVTVPASPLKHLGLAMEISPIVAVQDDSPAKQAGLKVSDKLLAIDGAPVGDPLTLGDRLAARGEKKENVKLRVKRGDQTLELTAELRPVTWMERTGPMGGVAAGALGIAYEVLPDVQDVELDSPAARAGIRKGDIVKAAQLVVPQPLLKANRELRQPPPMKLEGDERAAWPFFIEAIQTHHPRGTVRLIYQRGDETLTAEMQPVESKEFFNAELGFVLALDNRERQVQHIGEAARLGLRKTVDSLLMVYRFLQRLSQAQISPKMLGGPVTIARVAGQSAEEGFPALLMFLTMLSANLAVVNFLPIPVLDGGHMVFLIYEGIMGKPPSEKVFVLLSYLGLAFILTLMLFVLGLDFGFISRR